MIRNSAAKYKSLRFKSFQSETFLINCILDAFSLRQVIYLQCTKSYNYSLLFLKQQHHIRLRLFTTHHVCTAFIFIFKCHSSRLLFN